MLSSSQKGSVFRTFFVFISYTLFIIKAGEYYVNKSLNGFINGFNGSHRMAMGYRYE